MNTNIQPQTSKYLPIWNKLKADKYCVIIAPIVHHKKIIKMVRRRRDKDLNYLFELSEQHKIHKINVTITGTKVEFHLHEWLTPWGI